MSLVLHLVKWDVKRFQILLPLWLLLVVAGAALEGAWPGVAVAMAARQTVGITGNLLALAEVLFSVVFIALVVQEHPLVGTTAFWMTRPIPPRALLAAKLIVLFAAVVVAPVIAEIILMAVYKVPLREFADVALQTALFWTLWLSTVMTFAALTANIAKFALAVGGVLISMIVSIVIFAAIAMDRFAEEPPIPTAAGPYDPTSGVVNTVLLVSAALVLLVVLYRTRARPRAIAIGLAGVALAFALSDVWPWPWLAPQLETPAWAFEPSALQLSMSPGEVDVRDAGQHFGDTPTQWRIARAPLRLTGLASGWSAWIGLREASLQVSGREPLATRLRARAAFRAADDAESARQNDVMRRVLNVNHLVDYEQQRPEQAIVMVARIAELRQLGVNRAAYVGTFQVSLTRRDVEAVLPFRAGASVHLGAYRFTLARVTPYQYRISLLARESIARSAFDRRPRSHINYYLRNPNTSEAIHGSRRDLRTDTSLLSFLPLTVGVSASEGDSGGFSAHALEVNFPSSYGDQRPVVIDDKWLERSELVIVRTTEGGSVERRIAMEDFPIPTK
jgi:hypothetical protein